MSILWALSLAILSFTLLSISTLHLALSCQWPCMNRNSGYMHNDDQPSNYIYSTLDFLLKFRPITDELLPLFIIIHMITLFYYKLRPMH